MKDNLKSFIDKNLEAFNTEEPTSDLWSKIESNLDEKAEAEVKMIPVKSVWKIVLSSAAVLAIVFSAWQWSQSSQEHGSIAGSNMPEDFSNVEQLEKFYSVQVNQKIKKLESYNVDEDLLEEVAFLKEEFKVLKEEADKGLNQEDILDSMIDNYRLRVHILEEVMREVQRKSDKEVKNAIQ